MVNELTNKRNSQPEKWKGKKKWINEVSLLARLAYELLISRSTGLAPLSRARCSLFLHLFLSLEALIACFRVFYVELCQAWRRAEYSLKHISPQLELELQIAEARRALRRGKCFCPGPGNFELRDEVKMPVQGSRRDNFRHSTALCAFFRYFKTRNDWDLLEQFAHFALFIYTPLSWTRVSS